MKNKYKESQIKNAKKYAKRNPTEWGIWPEGIHVQHEYPDKERKFSWWDDFGFKLGSQYVAVWWVHPRMEYKDQVYAWAYEEWLKEVGDMQELEFEPIFIKVGKSRKKAKFFHVKDPEVPRDYTKLRKMEETALTLNDIVIKPSIKIAQYGWCRGVDIVYPVELLCEEDVVAFAKRIRAHLRGEIDIMAEVADYKYSCSTLESEKLILTQ